MSEPEDDEFKVAWGMVTNPVTGVRFPAMLGPCSKAGVRSFFVMSQDAPPGEPDGRRSEFFREVPGVTRPIYRFELGARG